MDTVIFLLAPATFAALLLGPFRRRPTCDSWIAYGAFVALSAVGALLFLGWSQSSRTAIAIPLALLCFPALGILLALRTETVLRQPWFAVVYLPIGYSIGLTLAYWLVFALGFEH